MDVLKIHDFPLEDRPRERLIHDGPESLANHELLAILLRTGSKKSLFCSLPTVCSTILKACGF